MIVDMILLDEKGRSMPAASILSGVVSVKVMCIRLVDLRSHGATIISHSLTPQSPFVSTIERPSQKRQTRRRIFPLSFFDSAATSSYEHWLIRTDNYHLKRELMYLSIVIGTGCSGYCLLALSPHSAVSYGVGVLFRLVLYFNG
ncbi:PREDICTED: uncharacterized protein LOC106310575 [Brassica oleracea var. oleracea]|uniref:uncharacterized protein LOC106310575 n=1 Tax=Brassica oleracea var. oleracea TaxID=109376 RepID=UPI0006A73BFE|nr:PREDICTED: uncharacterized protein LOC106310575 [Brassica oleracea var. oleracea]